MPKGYLIQILAFLTMFASHSCLADAVASSPDTTKINLIIEHPHAHWDVLNLPPDVRASIHLSASKAPPLPNEDPKWMNPRAWAAAATFGERPCFLWVQTGEFDAIWYTCTLDEVRSGHAYTLLYSDDACRHKSSPRLRLGPMYVWNDKGILGERCWYEANHCTHDYTYYPSGELLQFTYNGSPPIRNSEHGHWRHIEEMFARDGSLLGFYLVGLSTDVSTSYWSGEPVTYPEFARHTVEVQKRAWQ